MRLKWLYLETKKLNPLLEQGILLRVRETNKMINNDMHNFIIEFKI